MLSASTSMPCSSMRRIRSSAMTSDAGASFSPISAMASGTPQCACTSTVFTRRPLTTTSRRRGACARAAGSPSHPMNAMPVSAAAFAEVDPDDPLNEVITDIKLAPRNSRGMVEYNMDFWINKPVDMSRANGTLLHDVPNRGNVRSLELNVGGAADSNAGDGLLQ